MSTERTKVLVEVALCVALSATLALVAKFVLPWNIAGGSVSLSMLPIFVIALRRGVLVGLLTGLLFGVIDYFIEPWFVHPVQVFVDYGLAFAACGISGIGRDVVRSYAAEGRYSHAGMASVPYVLLGGVGRLCAAFVSGIVFFASNAPAGQPVWLYSLLYNASYIAPSLLACALLTALIVPALERAAPTSAPSALLRA